MAVRLAAVLCIAAARAALPQPTSWEKSLIQRVDAAARVASDAASAALEARLADPAVRADLAACSPETAGLSHAALAERLRQEVEVAEVISGFDSPMQGGPMGLDLAGAVKGPKHLQGLWEIGLRQGINFSNISGFHIPNLTNISRAAIAKGLEMLDYNEKDLYGLRPFKHAGAPATLQEAVERPAYTMVNLHRLDSGSQLYGDVSMVLDARLARGSSLVSAVDSGGWSTFCRNNSFHPPFKFPFKVNCSAYRGFAGLGTLSRFDHLFLASEAYWNASISRVACRLLAPWGSFPAHGSDLIHYWEAMPASEVPFPSGIRFVIGAFDALFGSAKGELLQRWCSENGWVLVWSLGHNVGMPGGMPLNFFTAPNVTWPLPSNKRLADPLVLANTTVKVAAGTDADMASAAFRAYWYEAKLLRNHSNDTVSNVTWAKAWQRVSEALPHFYQLMPLHAGACPGGPEACVGLSRGGDCLCYGPTPAAVLVV